MSSISVKRGLFKGGYQVAEANDLPQGNSLSEDIVLTVSLENAARHGEGITNIDIADSLALNEKYASKHISSEENLSSHEFIEQVRTETARLVEIGRLVEPNEHCYVVPPPVEGTQASG